MNWIRTWAYTKAFLIEDIVDVTTDEALGLKK